MDAPATPCHAQASSYMSDPKSIARSADEVHETLKPQSGRHYSLDLKLENTHEILPSGDICTSQASHSEKSLTDNSASTQQTQTWSQGRFRNAVQGHQSAASATESNVSVGQYVPIKGTQKNIYPCLPMISLSWTSEEYQERAAFVIGELKRAVEEDHKLWAEGRFIDYDPRMVGESPDTATPSIVVKCKKSVLSRLRKIFKERASTRLHCRVGSRVIWLFKGRATPFPPFNLVFVTTIANPLERRAADEDLAAFFSSPDTLCGALLRCGRRSATAGLMLQVDEIEALLTVDHLWEQSIETEADDKSFSGSTYSTSARTSESSSFVSDEHAEIRLGELWIDDEEEYNDDDDGPDENFTAGISGVRLPDVSLATASPPSAIVGQDGTNNIPVKGQRIRGNGVLHSSSPYLDWGLVQLNPELMKARRSNLFYPNGIYARPVLLQEISAAPASYAAPVYMISGVRGTIAGRLLDGFSYLGSRPGQDLCRAWTMFLCKPGGS